MKRRNDVSVLTATMMLVGLAPIPALAAGTLKATIKKGGDRPKRVVLDMAADANCVKARTNPDGTVEKVGSENAIVTKDGLVRNAIVYVKDGLGDKEFAAPEEKKVIDQKGCMYDPHVMTVQVGQKVTVRNSDSTLHNIHSFAQKQRAFNFAQPQQGMESEVDFQREEFVLVKCDVHPWMSAHIGVFKHPYHAVTDKSGEASVSDLPPGEYTIGVWHEEFGEQEQKVTIEEGKEATIEVTYS
jgi:plastocyanin